ncbi:hypothetical protein H7J07_05635 [Mycobacterium koreense]|uniref:Uncharacterized protein n=1 Tax=Mycolicibacillus koreensis TaxID=1069220 RepID=A0A7I7SCI1_9MYCO|nr:hypothetical protein [Mycolicibacillus koreensis]MCV7247706.1 hypothetical protein [Mycolicibacillus koreensis]OSC34760.1 hypothetical protein B8W67_05800 [Mycolicibacillus koreensis]BBY54091.1 hypothetical protein MKOR_13420 [Mycolicibacillus koreensis]
MAKMRKGEVYEFTENYVDGTGWEFTEGTRFRVTNEQHPYLDWFVALIDILDGPSAGRTARLGLGMLDVGKVRPVASR